MRVATPRVMSAVPFTARARIAVLSLGSLVLLGAIGEDELACEEASVHLADCCPELKSQAIDCDYRPPRCYDRGCERECIPAEPTYFTAAQARCLRDLDCADLEGEGCAALAHALDAAGESYSDAPDGAPCW
jgi:hypothetical protein